MPRASCLADALCLNLWLDETALTIPPTHRNLYTAHELAQMKPLVNKDHAYEQMMGLNRWGRKFLANAWQRDESINRRTDKWTSGRSRQNLAHQFVNMSIYPLIYLSNYLLTFLNSLAFRLQLAYMRPRQTTERVSLNAAFFHPGNRSQEILAQYRKQLDKTEIDI